MTLSLRNPIAITVILFTLAASAANAQIGPGPTIRVLGGLSSSTLADESSRSDPLTGLSIGAQMILQRGGAWAIVPELLLVDKGGKESSGAASVDADMRVLDFSLLARWSTGTSDALRRFFVIAGPSAGYVFTCDAGSGVGGVFLTGDCIDNVNRLDAGVTAGAGMEFPGSAIDWGFSVRYQHGFADLLKADGEVRSRTLLLLVSYRL